MFIMFSMHVHVCVHVCACMHMCACMGDSPTPLHPPHPHLPICQPIRGHPEISQNFNNTSNNQDISILFEDLKSVETPPPMGGCMVWWMGGWVDGWGQVKLLKI